MSLDKMNGNEKAFLDKSRHIYNNSHAQYFNNNNTSHNVSTTRDFLNNKTDLRCSSSGARGFKQIETISKPSNNAANTRNDFKRTFDGQKSSESDDLYYLQDSVHDFGERVKKLDNYLSSLEKHFFIYNNDMEKKSNTNDNGYYNEKNTKLTNSYNLEDNLLDYLKPILK